METKTQPNPEPAKPKPKAEAGGTGANPSLPLSERPPFSFAVPARFGGEDILVTPEFAQRLTQIHAGTPAMSLCPSDYNR